MRPIHDITHTPGHGPGAETGDQKLDRVGMARAVNVVYGERPRCDLRARFAPQDSRRCGFRRPSVCRLITQESRELDHHLIVAAFHEWPPSAVMSNVAVRGLA